MVDTSQQRGGEDGTAGKSDSPSDQSQPPTETMVSLTTASVVSVIAQNTSLISLAHAHERACISLCLSHPLARCVDINFLLPDRHITPYLQACTHTQTQTNTRPHTHPGTDKFTSGEQQKLKGWFVVTVCLISACRGSDLSVIYESLECPSKALNLTNPLL